MLKPLICACALCNDAVASKEVEFEGCKLTNGSSCAPCSEAVKLNGLIAEEIKDLTVLISRQLALRNRINNAHDPISQRLPPEVSARIFMFSLSAKGPPSLYEVNLLNRSKKLAISTPLTLGAVCHMWRNIVWGSPYLWSTLSISVIVPRVCDTATYFDIGREWLSRSGQLPLSIRFYTPASHRTHPSDLPSNLDKLFSIHLEKFMKIYLPRCYQLEFSCPTPLLPSISGEAPLLERLNITSPNNRNARSMQIHHTKSEGMRVSIKEYSVVVAYWNVKIFDFDGFLTTEECALILQTYPHLHGLHVPLLRTPTNQTEFLPETWCLKNLTLYPPMPDPWPSLSDSNWTNFPKPTHIIAKDVEAQTVQSFMGQSYNYLRYLRLELCKPNSDHWEELSNILQAANLLEELILTYNPAHFTIDPLLKELGRAPLTGIRRKLNDSSCPPFLPRLSVLSINFLEETSFPWNLVADIFGSLDGIRSAPNPTRPIQKLSVVNKWSEENAVSGNKNDTRYYANKRLQAEVAQQKLLMAFPDKLVTQRFLDIAHRGVKIDLFDTFADEDILKMAMEYHNIPIPDWYENDSEVDFD